MSERVVGEDQWLEGRGTTLREVVSISFVWLAVGVSLFLLFLGGANLWLVHEPVRGGAFYGRTLGLVVSLIVLWIVAARPLTRIWFRRGTATRIVIVVLLAAGAVGSSLAFGATVRDVPSPPMLMEVGGRFAFGAYPDDQILAELQEFGFTGVVSVLEPGGEPDEASLLERERAALERAGLELIWAPLYSGGEVELASLVTLKRLIEDGTGTYYVHGLTEDSRRLALTRRLLLRLGARRRLLAVQLSDGLVFERGPVFELDAGVHLTPFPTDAELLEYVAASPTLAVVALLDPEDPDDREWIEHEREILEVVGVELQVAPLQVEPFDPVDALSAADRIRELDGPVVVQAFLTPSVAADAVRLTWSTGLPPLPAGVFTDTLSGGPVSVIAPHVATGPRPVTREFGWLYVRGVRNVALFGGLSPAQRSEDRRLSDVAGLEWYFSDGDAERLLDELARDGPWYVYGTRLESIAARITERFGAPLPTGQEEASGGIEHQQE